MERLDPPDWGVAVGAQFTSMPNSYRFVALQVVKTFTGINESFVSVNIYVHIYLFSIYIYIYP